MQEIQKLLERYKAGKRNFSGIDLSGAKLDGTKCQIDLSGADFRGANFSEAELYGWQGQEINLSHTNFSHATLENAILSDVNLESAHFCYANLRNIYIDGKVNLADFSRADLTDACLEPKELNQTKFVGANLINAKLGRCDHSNTHLDFTDANCVETQFLGSFIWANFKNSNLKAAIFHLSNDCRANLSYANLSNLDLRDRDFSQLEMVGANLNGANLTNANFTGANLQGVDFQNANLDKVNFTHANLRDTQLEGAIALDSKIKTIWKIVHQGANIELLKTADLKGANLNHMDFVWLDLRSVNFQNVCLIGANFNHANLSGVNLEGANLTEAQFKKADLSRTNLSQSNLEKTCFLGANLENADLTQTNLKNVDFTHAKLLGAKWVDAINPPEFLAGFCQAYNNPSYELLEQIQESCKDLYHESCSSDPYEVFLWETRLRGDFTLEGLLKACQHMQEIPIAEFRWAYLDNIDFEVLSPTVYYDSKLQAEIEYFRILLDRLDIYLTNLKVFLLESHRENCHFIIGNTPSGDYLGIARKMSYWADTYWLYHSNPIFREEDMTLSKPQNKELILILKNAISNIEFLQPNSESFVWEISEKRSSLIHNLLDTTRAISTHNVEYVFRKTGYITIEPNDFVMKNLSHLRLYRVGVVWLHMYFVGQTRNGDWIVIRTESSDS
ncbi:pentapeptide repeat-containing protein [Baaleninema simplex]|uniref:pentapeptide repeat-containing protein n=1 Tax=Baaleninema simplex TaxID=2862350 RepID=UPI00034B0719|nr:pentapeptide repeat-containing protein [Baaleninema simplex]